MASCYFDKKCSVCLSYYLLGRIHVDGGDRRGVGTQEPVAFRNGRMAPGGWHDCDCTNRRGMCDDEKIVDDDALHKALRN